MTMSAQSVAFVDHFAQAREELEAVFKQMTEAGASHHVALGKLVSEGMARRSSTGRAPTVAKCALAHATWRRTWAA
jgi:hypothetical protein